MALCLVVFRRKSGLLLAVPEDFIAQETLAAGMLAGPEDIIGPSHTITVPAGVGSGHRRRSGRRRCRGDKGCAGGLLGRHPGELEGLRSWCRPRGHHSALFRGKNRAVPAGVAFADCSARLGGASRIWRQGELLFCRRGAAKACGEWWRRNPHPKGFSSCSTSRSFWWRKAAAREKDTNSGSTCCSLSSPFAGQNHSWRGSDSGWEAVALEGESGEGGVGAESGPHGFGGSDSSTWRSTLDLSSSSTRREVPWGEPDCSRN